MDRIFCKIANGEAEWDLIFEDEKVSVFLSNAPAWDGYMLVVPKTHLVTMEEVVAAGLLEHVVKIGLQMEKLAEEKLGAEGAMFAWNMGCAQEVKHFHLHVVPKTKEICAIEAERNAKRVGEPAVRETGDVCELLTAGGGNA